MATLIGDDGDNTLTGGPDNDRLIGKGGRDTLTGNAIFDEFVYGPETVQDAERGVFDRITDFRALEGNSTDFDVIEIAGIFNSYYEEVGFDNRPDPDDVVRVVEDPTGSFAYVLVDANARDGGADFVAVAQLDDVHAGDVVRTELTDIDRLINYNATVQSWQFGWRFEGAADFNGDGKTDVLLRHDDGEAFIWNTVETEVKGVSLGIVDHAWNIETAADFNDDGRAEIVWRHDNGEVLVDGVSIGQVDNAWHIEAAADFIGDGRAEILWRHDNGEVLIDNISLGIVDDDWQIATTGDFDGDGKNEILWRNDNGNVELNGVRIVNLVDEWTIVGATDYDGSGTDDIVLRHENGEAFVFFMNGTEARGQSLGIIDNIWELEALGDFSGDGSSDLLLRRDDGQLYADGRELGNLAISTDSEGLLV